MVVGCFIVAVESGGLIWFVVIVGQTPVVSFSFFLEHSVFIGYAAVEEIDRVGD